MHMHKEKDKRFSVVDLDPYGSPTAFLDGAVQCVEDGGLLIVTCTDMAVLCGNSTEACFAKYGSTSTRTSYCHEFALRILLRSIESNANRYSRYIEPLLSLSIDFYIRVFVRVRSSKVHVKDSVCKISNVHICSDCESFVLQPLAEKRSKDKSIKYANAASTVIGEVCEHCGGGNQKIAGPVWSKQIHNAEFVKHLYQSAVSSQDESTLGTHKRIIGMLGIASEELPDAIFYYRPDRLCNIAKTTTPKLKVFRSALLNAGYHVSSSHASPLAVKTDASPDVIWDIIRCWAKSQNIKTDKFPEGSCTAALHKKEPRINADFTLRRDATQQMSSIIEGVCRYPLNPTKNWGPKARAKPKKR